jgi:hypothetical protein
LTKLYSAGHIPWKAHPKIRVAPPNFNFLNNRIYNILIIDLDRFKLADYKYIIFTYY